MIVLSRDSGTRNSASLVVRAIGHLVPGRYIVFNRNEKSYWKIDTAVIHNCSGY